MATLSVKSEFALDVVSSEYSSGVWTAIINNPEYLNIDDVIFFKYSDLTTSKGFIYSVDYTTGELEVLCPTSPETNTGALYYFDYLFTVANPGDVIERTVTQSVNNLLGQPVNTPQVLTVRSLFAWAPTVYANRINRSTCERTFLDVIRMAQRAFNKPLTVEMLDGQIYRQVMTNARIESNSIAFSENSDKDFTFTLPFVGEIA